MTTYRASFEKEDIMTAYVFAIEDETTVVALITGADEREIERTFEQRYDTDAYGLTYRNPEPHGVKVGDGWGAA